MLDKKGCEEMAAMDDIKSTCIDGIDQRENCYWSLDTRIESLY